MPSLSSAAPSQYVLDDRVSSVEAAAARLQDIATCHGRIADAPALLPVPSKTDAAGNDRKATKAAPAHSVEGVQSDDERDLLREASGVLCRLCGQLAYWVLTDELPLPGSAPAGGPPSAPAKQHEKRGKAGSRDEKRQEESHPLAEKHAARHLRFAEKASCLASGLSGCVRSEEGGAPLLGFNAVNLLRVKSLLERGGEVVARVPAKYSAELDALRELVQWCTSVLAVASVLLPKVPDSPEAAPASPQPASPRTLHRVALVGEGGEKAGVACGGGGGQAQHGAPASSYPQPITERGLQLLFLQYDTEGRGWITRRDMMEIWEDSELSALPQSRGKLKEALDKYSTQGERVSYDEYTIVMFKLYNL